MEMGGGDPVYIITDIGQLHLCQHFFTKNKDNIKLKI